MSLRIFYCKSWHVVLYVSTAQSKATTREQYQYITTIVRIVFNNGVEICNTVSRRQSMEMANETLLIKLSKKHKFTRERTQKEPGFSLPSLLLLLLAAIVMHALPSNDAPKKCPRTASTSLVVLRCYDIQHHLAQLRKNGR